jgi:hypothetical protein
MASQKCPNNLFKLHPYFSNLFVKIVNFDDSLVLGDDYLEWYVKTIEQVSLDENTYKTENYKRFYVLFEKVRKENNLPKFDKHLIEKDKMRAMDLIESLNLKPGDLLKIDVDNSHYNRRIQCYSNISQKCEKWTYINSEDVITLLAVNMKKERFKILYNNNIGYIRPIYLSNNSHKPVFTRVEDTE